MAHTSVMNGASEPIRWFSTCLLAAAICLIARETPASSLFEGASHIEAELTGPFHLLFADKSSRETLPFRLEVGGVALDIEVRTRGKSRLRVCDFPPLRLYFQDEQPPGSPFDGQDRLKLVTHCRNEDSGEANAIEEYLAYRIFGLISPVSYRVRLLLLTYTDTAGALDPDARRRFGFVIEPTQQLAERAGGVPVNLPGLAPGRMNREQAALVYVFQYLIGNTDWSFVLADGDDACCHNGDLIEIGGEIYYVPYDFDLSGLVNAPYAKPARELNIPSVRMRRYRGFCEERETVLEALRQVKALEPQVLKIAREAPGLGEKHRKKAGDYLARFFDKARNEEKLLKSFERRCVKPRTASIAGSSPGREPGGAFTFVTRPGH